MNLPLKNLLTNQQFVLENTSPNEIWSAAYERIVDVVKGFTTYRRTPALTLQPADLPCLAVYLLRDREAPLGDSNAGEPRFMHYVHLGISGIIKASDVGTQLETLAQKVLSTRVALYTLPKFIRLIEGFESTDTRLVFSRLGETSAAEYQMEMVLKFPTYWPPDVPDDFLTTHFETRFPPGSDPAKVMQVVREWDVDQNS